MIIQKQDMPDLLGETTEYDKKLKVEEKDPRSWCKSISAFANGVGGCLIFGIADDTNEIVGVPNPQKDSETISRIIRDRMDPIPVFNLRFETINRKTLIILEISAGKETPYYYIGRNERSAYHRVGNESVICNSLKLRELTLRGVGKSFDSLPSGYDFADMSFTKLKSTYFQRIRDEFKEAYFASFGLLDGQNNLTNAGALLADNCPVYQSRLFCTRWNGLTKASRLQDALDDAEFSGSVIALLQEGVAFVKRNSRKGWYKEDDRRIELPDYPMRSVTEGLVNALVHRDYVMNGAEVHIDIFDDRLEICSPGGMLDGINIQERELSNIPSLRRNPVIADVFSRLDYMERRGSGIRKIIDNVKKQHNYAEGLAPKFFSEGGYFILTLMNLNYKSDASNQFISTNMDVINGPANGEINRAANDEINSVANGEINGEINGDENIEVKLTKTDLLILNVIVQNPQLTRTEIARQTGLGTSSIDRTLKKFKTANIVRRQGSNKTGYWEIRKNFIALQYLPQHHN